MIRLSLLVTTTLVIAVFVKSLEVVLDFRQDVAFTMGTEKIGSFHVDGDNEGAVVGGMWQLDSFIDARGNALNECALPSKQTMFMGLL